MPELEPYRWLLPFGICTQHRSISCVPSSSQMAYQDNCFQWCDIVSGPRHWIRHDVYGRIDGKHGQENHYCWIGHSACYVWSVYRHIRHLLKKEWIDSLLAPDHNRGRNIIILSMLLADWSWPVRYSGWSSMPWAKKATYWATSGPCIHLTHSLMFAVMVIWAFWHPGALHGHISECGELYMEEFNVKWWEVKDIPHFCFDIIIWSLAASGMGLELCFC